MFRNLRRPASDWKLFARAYGWVWGIRLALWAAPFSRVYDFTIHFRQGRVGDRELDAHSVYKIVWAVSAAARRVPRATCLTQALATQILLGRRGHRTSLQLGILKSKAGGIDAHAWIERDGRVLIGANDTFSQMTRLPPLHGER